MNLLALKIMTAEITASTILMDRNNATILDLQFFGAPWMF
jgi:hypothetical protein